jgi:glycine betaine/choline ABC-type transport system substrate-binding protein
MVMSSRTPFQNKDAIAVTEEYARENRLETIADLAEGGPFRFGARPEFESLYLGLEGLVDVYGWTEAEFVPLELGTQYDALDAGEVDAVNAFTTDPQLGTGDYVLLDDTELLFGSQNVVMVVGEEKLDRIDADAFMTIVDAVNRELTEAEMVRMNAAVTDGRDEAEVASAFLRGVGLRTPLDLG